ncbi:MAG: DUF1735 domain-containing protein [Tannerellaceae bacterium]|jgi:hypothetical protein|nr:DUF1735 domain-containing protein [Tannerellaceae bacterium]
MKTRDSWKQVLLLGVIVLSGCLSEEPPFKDNGSSGIVELNLAARTSATTYAIRKVSWGEEESIVIPVEVNYTGAAGAPAEIEVKLSLANDAVAEFVAAQGYTLLPAASYEVPEVVSVRIAKGEKKAEYRIEVEKGLLESGVQYAIGVKIVSSSGGTVSGNYSTGVYVIVE